MKKSLIFRIWKYINSLQVKWNKTMPIPENKAISEAWQEKRETWGQEIKCKCMHQEKIFKPETWETLLIIMNGAQQYCTLCTQLAEVRNILFLMSFARLSALWINLFKTSKILVRFLKFKFLKLISTITVFLVIVKINKISCNKGGL